MSMKANHAWRIPALLAGLSLVTGSAFAQGGITKEKQGKGGSVVQGAAGGVGLVDRRLVAGGCEPSEPVACAL